METGTPIEFYPSFRTPVLIVPEWNGNVLNSNPSYDFRLS